jgi:YVTN family beta-propeller protein
MITCKHLLKKYIMIRFTFIWLFFCLLPLTIVGQSVAPQVTNFSASAEEEKKKPKVKVQKVAETAPGKSKDKNTIPKNLPIPAQAAQKAVGQPSFEPTQSNTSVNVPLSPVAESTFEGLDDNGTQIPPDVGGAVGPNHIMVTLNSQYRIQSKTGNTLWTLSGDTFWEGTGTPYSKPDAFDPKIQYDPYSNRWILVAIANAWQDSSKVLIAVSQTDDPTGNWNRYSIDADIDDNEWADYPSVGFNNQWITVSGNMYSMNGGYSTNRIWVLNKNTLYTGGTLTTIPVFNNSEGFTIVPAQTHDITQNTQYLLCAWNLNANGYAFLRIFTITGTANAPVFNATNLFPSVDQPCSYSPTVDAPQLGSTQRISSGDTRLQSVIYRHGALWCTHTAYLPAASPTRAGIYWWKVNPTVGTISQFGKIDDPTAVMHRAFPSLAVDAYENMMIGYSQFSANQYASSAYSYRAVTDAPNSLQSPTQYKNGEAPYYKTFGAGINRWGDYSSTVIDPSEDNVFWTLQEFAATPQGGNDRWGIQWAKLKAPCDAPVIVDPITNISVTAATINWAMISGARSYIVEYKRASDATWTVLQPSLTTSQNITNLQGSTDYNVRVKTTCTGLISNYSTVVNFRTADIMAYVPNILDNTVSILNIQTNTATGTINIADRPYSVAVNPTGSKVYITRTLINELSVINTANNAVSNITLPFNGRSVAVNPNGLRAYVTHSTDGALSIINTAHNTVIKTLNIAGSPFGVAVSPDASRVYVTNNSTNEVHIINAITNTLIQSVAVGTNPLGIAVSPDGSKVYVANEGSDNISVITTSDNTVSNITLGSSPRGIVVIPNGQKVYVTTGINEVKVINTADNTVVIPTITVGTTPYGISVHPNGTAVYAVNAVSNNVSVINTTTNAVTSINVGNAPYALGNIINGQSAKPSCTTLTSPASAAFNIARNAQLAWSAATAASGYRLSLGTTSGGTNILNNVDVGNLTTYTPLSMFPIGTRIFVKITPYNAAGDAIGCLEDYFTTTTTGGDDIYAYIPNSGSNDVSVVYVATNTVVGNIPVGAVPYGVSVNIDGSKVYISNSGAGNISVINGITNTVSSTITVGGEPRGIVVNPFNTKIYVANRNLNTIQILNTTNNTVIKTISTGAGSRPEAIAVSADGLRYAVSCYESKTILVYNAETDVLIHTITTADVASPAGLAFSPTDISPYKIYTALNSINKIQYFDLNNTITNGTITVGNTPYGITFNSDGTKIYTTHTGSNTISVITKSTNTIDATPSVWNSPKGISISPNGAKVYVANMGNNKVFILNTATNLIVDSVEVGTAPIALGNFITPNSVVPACVTQTLPSTGEQNIGINATIKWQPVAGATGYRITLGNSPSSGSIANNIDVGSTTEYDPLPNFANNTSYYVNIVPYNRRGDAGSCPSPYFTTVVAGGTSGFAYITNRGSNNVSVINTINNNVTATIKVGTNPTGVAVSPDGAKVYIANENGRSISVIDAASNSVLNTIDLVSNPPYNQHPFGLAVSPDGSKLYISTRSRHESTEAIGSAYINVFNTTTYSLIATITTESPDGPNGLIVSPDGTKLYATNNSTTGKVYVINTATNSVATTINVGTKPYGIAIKPDGSKVYVANQNDATVSVINTADNTVATFPIGTTATTTLTGVALSADGARLYVTDALGHTLKVINTSDNEILTSISTGGQKPIGVSIAPDGKKVYVANANSNTVSVINPATNLATNVISVGTEPWAFGNFINVNSAYFENPPYICWSGAVSNVWALASNWLPNKIPTATDSIIIGAGVTNVPVLASNTTVRGAYIFGNTTSVSGAGRLTTTNLTWAGGTIACPLTTTNIGETFINTNIQKTLQGAWTNSGKITWVDGNIHFNTGSITNNGTFRVQPATPPSGLAMTRAVGTTNLFTNNNLVSILYPSGYININIPFTNNSLSFVQSTDASSTAQVFFRNGFTNFGYLTGLGTGEAGFYFESGTVSFNAGTSISGNQFGFGDAATVTFATPVNFGTSDIKLYGNATLQTTGSGSFIGGRMIKWEDATIALPMTINNGSTLLIDNISTSSNHILRNATLTNNGNIDWRNSVITFDNGTLQNNRNVYFNLTRASAMLSQSGTTNNINNCGTFNVSATPISVPTISVPLSNCPNSVLKITGAMPLNAGTYMLSQSFNGAIGSRFGMIQYNNSALPPTAAIQYASDNNALSLAVTAVVSPQYIDLDIKVFLEGGSYSTSTSLMSNTLRLNNHIPQVEPYTTLTPTLRLAGEGNENLSNGGTSLIPPIGTMPSDDIVDWVLVTLKNSTNVTIATRAALLKRNGRVVDIDNTSLLRFYGVSAGSYYVSVRHRNHLGLRTAATIPLSATSTTLDFTNNSISLSGTSPLKLVAPGIYALYAGDLNQDGNINATDRSAAWNSRNLTGYNPNDCSLNGTVDATDRSNTWNNRNISNNF